MDTNIVPIINDIVSVLVKYGFEFLEKCDTLEKFQNNLITKEQTVISSTFALNKPAWNLLALAILLENIPVEQVIEQCEQEIMKRGLRWEMDKWEIAKKRIDTYEVISRKL